jgi:iron complex transport system ATP-binding protein
LDYPEEPKLFRILLRQMKMDQAAILSVSSLKIGYRSGKKEKVLLTSLNANAGRGELIAVIGRNGIGKSTLLKTLTGLHPSLGGDIIFSGKNIRDYSRMELAMQVGYLSTEIVKVSNMKVYDLVALGRFPHINWLGKIDQENHEAIIDALKKTSMSKLSDSFVSEISDGERQRAMIARILAQDTSIMILDEPTAFLDIGSKYEILHLMNILSHKSGKTILFSTHDLNIAISQSDKIWLILEDKLLEGAPEDLLMDGAFDHLFDSSPVRFDSANGTFSFINEIKNKIYIEGVGIRRQWVEKAIKRAGFLPSDLKTLPYIIIPENNKNEYQLSTQDSVRYFGSIYELVRYLGTEVIITS